jgi:DNA-binding beta-propeller fold protein YncE
VSPDQPVVYVTGMIETVTPALSWDYSTVAYNTLTGAILWTARSRVWDTRPFTGENNDDPMMSVSPDGSTVFVVGEIRRDDRPSDLILAYDAATGTQRWVGHPGATWADLASHPVAVSPDSSTVYVTGTPGGRNPVGYTTVAYNVATGAQLWSAATQFPQMDAESRQASGITVAPDGSAVFVTGRAGTVAYDAATGAQLWRDHYKQRWGWWPVGIAASPDSSLVYVTTTKFIVAYNAATGTTAWRRPFATASNYPDPVNMALSPDGSRLFVVAQTEWPPDGTQYYVTMAFSTVNGARLWTASGPGRQGLESYPAGLAVNPAGTEVVVTGFINTSVGGDEYATVSYDAATGAQRWLDYAEGTQPSDLADASAVAISADGKQVFVTGSDANYDRWPTLYLTVAYQA